MQIKKIILDYDLISKITRYQFEYDSPTHIPFTMGKTISLIPEDIKLIGEDEQINTPLFNESDLGRIVVNIGQYGLYYLSLRTECCLDKIVFTPKNLVIDTYYNGGKRALIYSFYNTGKDEQIIITAQIKNDKGNTHDQLKSAAEDIEFRDYILKRSFVGNKIKPIEPPSIMTIDELASYIKFKKGTIYNWIHDNSIPHKKVNGSIRFIRDDIDNWIKTGELKSKQKK